MSAEAFKTAQQLIKQQKYDEARALLRTLDHPLAPAWLASLEGLGTAEARERGSWLWLVVVVLIVAAIGLGVYGLLVAQQNQLAADAGQVLSIDARVQDCIAQGSSRDDCMNRLLPAIERPRTNPAPGSLPLPTPAR